MPIYEFECACGYKFEKIEKINQITSPPCPKCGAYTKKIISLSNFKVNGYNAKNGYHKTKNQQFVEDGPYMAERRQKKDGKKTAADSLL